MYKYNLVFSNVAVFLLLMLRFLKCCSFTPRGHHKLKQDQCEHQSRLWSAQAAMLLQWLWCCCLSAGGIRRAWCSWWIGVDFWICLHKYVHVLSEMYPLFCGSEETFCLFCQGLPGKDGLSGRKGDKGEDGVVGLRGIKVFPCLFVHWNGNLAEFFTRGWWRTQLANSMKLLRLQRINTNRFTGEYVM